MSTYEVEHNTPEPSAATQAPRRRPDLSSFFATLREITPAPDHRPHAVPVPGDVSAAFLSLADAYEVLRNQARSQGGDGNEESLNEEMVNAMIQTLLNDANSPPREVEGASEEFCAELDRVPKSALNPSQVCPICNNPFLDDEFPLVVRLPCHPSHLFDLECVKPWLRLRGTCPLDRFDFAKQEREKAEALKRIADEDEEEEWDGMYG